MIIKAKEEYDAPSSADAEVFLRKVNLFPEGYTVLYVSEADNDIADELEEMHLVPEYIPEINTAELEL